MPGMLQYVLGVRLIVDRFDSQLWHFSVRGQRYDMRVRGGAFLLYRDTHVLVGRYRDWSSAVAAAKEQPGSIPVVSPSW